MESNSEKPHEQSERDDASALFGSQAHSLYTGVQAFTPQMEALHRAFKSQAIADWPLVLQTTILHTTAVSLYKVLPPYQPNSEAIDRRSIATLIRNLVDTHDTLDFLCNASSPEQFKLHRAILGYYLSGRIQTVQKQIAPADAQQFYPQAKARYWKTIDQAIDDKNIKQRLKNGESLFYAGRMERIRKACEEHAEFVRGVLTDLSTYVHSVPPSLWFSSIAESFEGVRSAHGILAVWLQVANFYYAHSIRIVERNFAFERSTELNSYLDRYRKVFSE
jgi:hypothetical protein